MVSAPLPVLDLLEASLRPPTGAGAPGGVAAEEPWLAALLAGRAGDREAGVAALRQCRFFDDLAGDHVDELAAAAPRRTLAVGERLVEAGAPGDAMFAVLAGELEGTGAPPPRFGAGAMLGELALIDRAPRAMTLTAIAPTTVLVIDQPTFTRALARWPEFGGALLRTLAARG